jgi:hypothetical protein
MKLQKFRWSKVYESQEEELLDFLKARGVTAERSVVDEFEVFGPRDISRPTTLWCAEGSASFVLDVSTISMQAGDAIHIPADTKLVVRAGMSGCVCYEATTPTSFI